VHVFVSAPACNQCARAAACLRASWLGQSRLTQRKIRRGREHAYIQQFGRDPQEARASACCDGRRARLKAENEDLHTQNCVAK